MNRPIPLPGRSQGGIALIEALLAVVLLAIGLFGTVGLQARAYSALTEAGVRAEATIAAERLLGVMTADPANLSGYQLSYQCTAQLPSQTWLRPTCAAIPNASVAITVAAPTATVPASDVSITIRWPQRQANAQNNQHVLRAFI